MAASSPVEQWPRAWLPIPAPGEVLAAYGWQHHPLSVVTDEDGSALVLDATSPGTRPTFSVEAPDRALVDGSAARYDRVGPGGDLRALRLLWGARGWQEPSFAPEAMPQPAPARSVCAGRRTRPGERGIEEIASGWLGTVDSWLWVRAAVKGLRQQNGLLNADVGMSARCRSRARCDPGATLHRGLTRPAVRRRVAAVSMGAGLEHRPLPGRRHPLSAAQ
jgi:hypothetical protein